MSPTVPPEEIDRLGRDAARLATEAKISLSDAVVRVVKDRPYLNQNHIHTVCWEANNEYFRQVALAREEAGEDLLFVFSPADPATVLKTLNASPINSAPIARSPIADI